MRIRNILLAAAAAALAFAACKDPEPVPVDPKVDIDITSADFDPAEQSITLHLTSTIDWTLKDYTSEVKSWVTVSPESGSGSESAQTVTISVTANKGADRTADITFYGNKAYNATLKISQKGEKGDDSEITVAEFLKNKDTQTEYILTGAIGNISKSASYWGFYLKDATGEVCCAFPENWDEYSANLHTGDQVRIKGKYAFYEQKSQEQLSDGQILSHSAKAGQEIQSVTVAEFLSKADSYSIYRLTGKVASAVDASYCSFTLKDDTGSVKVYTVNNAAEWGSKVKQNGTVTLRGAYQLYTDKSGKTTDEVVDADIEDFKAGEDPVSKPATVAEVIAEHSETTLYKLKGTITNWATGTNSSGKTWYQFDLKDATGSILVYSFTNIEDWLDKGISVNGNTVELEGNYSYYASKSQHEIINAKILSVEGGDTPPTPGPDEPTTWTEVTVKEFIAKPVNTTDWYQLTGTITNIAKADYGNFYIQDAAGDQLYVYGMTSKWVGSNDKSFASIGLAVGDIVTFRTLRDEYNGEPQAGGSTIPAYYISHEKGKPTEYPEGTVILTFPDENKASNQVNGYDEVWTAKAGANSFTMVQFNNYKWNGWSYVRCGRKTASVASISSDAIAAKLDKVLVNLDTVTASDINSITLKVASDAGFSNIVASVPASGIKAGELAIQIPADKQAAGLYYQVEFDCKASSAGKNGFVQISKFVFVAAE